MSRNIVTKWTPIRGQWDVTGSNPTYLGPEQPDWTYGICVSDVEDFCEGTVEISVSFPKIDDGVASDTSARVLFGFQSANAEYFTVGLGGNGRAFLMAPYEPDTGWTPIDEGGMQKDLIPDHQYKLAVSL